MIQTEDINRIWRANQDLWENKLLPTLLVPLEEKGGVNAGCQWQKIVAAGFGRSLQTFEAVQLLCAPDRPRRLWTEAFILTRAHYENFITLEWIAQEPEDRAQLLIDEFPLKMAHMLEMLGKKKEQVNQERRKEITDAAEEVRKRRSLGPGRLHLLPKLQQRVRDLSEPLMKTYPNLEWEYEAYYRDVSGFAHASGWGVALSISNPGEGVENVEPRLETGHNAVLNNGGWFFRILDLWNRVFNVLPREKLVEWHTDWATQVVEQ